MVSNGRLDVGAGAEVGAEVWLKVEAGWVISGSDYSNRKLTL